MLPNLFIFDKNYRVLRNLKFDSPISFENLYEKSGIKDAAEFAEVFDYLGKAHYLSLDADSHDVTLYCISSKREYITNRWQFRFIFIGTISAVVAAVFSLIDLFDN